MNISKKALNIERGLEQVRFSIRDIANGSNIKECSVRVYYESNIKDTESNIKTESIMCSKNRDENKTLLKMYKHIINDNNRIGSLFSFKAKLPASLQTSLVHKVSCTHCVYE